MQRSAQGVVAGSGCRPDLGGFGMLPLMETGAGPPTQDGTDVMGRRIGAALLDLLVLVVVFGVLAVVLGDTSASGGSAQARLGPGGTLLFLAILLLYYFAQEASGGRTLGKRALGIRVVSDAGGAASGGQVAVRTLLRLVDTLPILYLVGFIVALLTPKKQRLGDLAGGTRVVRA